MSYSLSNATSNLFHRHPYGLRSASGLHKVVAEKTGLGRIYRLAHPPGGSFDLDRSELSPIHTSRKHHRLRLQDVSETLSPYKSPSNTVVTVLPGPRTTSHTSLCSQQATGSRSISTGVSVHSRATSNLLPELVVFSEHSKLPVKPSRTLSTPIPETRRSHSTSCAPSWPAVSPACRL